MQKQRAEAKAEASDMVFLNVTSIGNPDEFSAQLANECTGNNSLKLPNRVVADFPTTIPGQNIMAGRIR